MAAVAASQPARAMSMGDMLWEHTLDYLRRLDEKRQERFEALQTPEDLEALRQKVRSRLLEMWGPFPATRTALNPRHVGTIERPDCRIEKIVYESRPQFFVTANLYRPLEVSAPLPAVVFLPDHVALGKAHPPYQHFCRLLARLGFVVLTLDPIGQGERLRVWGSENGAAGEGLGLSNHVALGRQCYLLGLNLMHYRVWDTIRAVDYLATRSEVDAQRIGIAGHSVGGVEILQLACYESRVQVAVAMCPAASSRDEAEARLLGDPEQNLYEALRYGIDHPELLASFAPRPLMIGSPVKDRLPIEATRRTYKSVAKAYSILDAAGKTSLVETAGGQELAGDLQRAAAGWLLQWSGDPAIGRLENSAAPQEEVLSAAELNCTAGGQVNEALDARTILSWNQELAGQIAPRRNVPTTRDEFEIYKGEIAQRVRDITHVGRFKPEAGIYVPDRTFEVGAFSRGVALVVSDLGKDHPLVRRGLIDPLVSGGYRVVALDLRGWGASAPRMPRFDVNFSWDDFFAYRALEMGRPLLGQRMKDLLAVGPKRALRNEWILAGVGAGALVAAHAAALEPRVNRLISVGGLLSYRSLLNDPLGKEPFSSYLPGVIGAYDVRDLYAALAPRPVLVVNPASPRRIPLERVPAWEELDWTAQVYEAMGAASSFSLATKVSSIKTRKILLDWLRT